MLLYPGAKWAPLGPPASPPMMTGHDRLLIHAIVGSMSSARNMFGADGWSGAESTFGLGGKWSSKDIDGALEQWCDAMREADCQIEGDYNSLSVECADDGGNGQGPPFTEAQVEALTRLLVWYCDPATHRDCPPSWTCHRAGVPCVEIPDSKAGHRGIGWHRKGVNSAPLYQSGYRQPGGELWSSSVGKICPRGERIEQIRTRIIPEAARRLAGVIPAPDPAPTPARKRAPTMFRFKRVNPAAGTRLYNPAAATAILTDFGDKASAEIGKALADPLYVAALDPGPWELLMRSMGWKPEGETAA